MEETTDRSNLWKYVDAAILSLCEFIFFINMVEGSDIGAAQSVTGFTVMHVNLKHII